MSKTHIYIVLMIVLFTVASCGSPSADTVAPIEVPVTVEVTRLVEVEKEVEVTRLVEVETAVEVTRLVEVEVTAVPTATPEPPVGGSKIGMNYVAEAESGGIHVQVARVLIANKADVPIDFTGSDVEDLDVVGEVLYIITNNSDKTVNLYPDQGTVQINNELIQLLDYWMGLGDDISGEIPPGVQLIGGQWFGIQRNAPEDVKEIIIRFDGPTEADTFERLGDDFEIIVDLSAQTFEPLPPELE